VSYHSVFDASAVHYPVWRWVAPWLLGLIAGVALAAFPRIYTGRFRHTRVLGVAVGVGCSIAVIGIVMATSSQQNRIVGALAEKRYEQVEGTVVNFRPGAADSHPPEEFDVGSHHYRYAPAEDLYGFNQVAGNHGPLRNGVRVRIADVDGIIARLEIADSTSSRMPSNER